MCHLQMNCFALSFLYKLYVLCVQFLDIRKRPILPTVLGWRRPSMEKLQRKKRANATEASFTLSEAYDSVQKWGSAQLPLMEKLQKEQKWYEKHPSWKKGNKAEFQ
jgi:hypothetical protein